MPIHFFSEDIDFHLKEEAPIRNWITTIADSYNHRIEDINYVFCSDEYLLDINKTHLDHDYYTDIITFDNSEETHVLEADIFISVDRVEENSKSIGTDFSQELYRVIIHGLLHLLGFGDKTDSEKKEMREKEDSCISLLKV